MAEETTPIPGDYHLLTLVFPPLASKCLEDHSLPACLHVAPGAQQPGSALMLGAGVQPSTRDPEHGSSQDQIPARQETALPRRSLSWAHHWLKLGRAGAPPMRMPLH